MGVYERSFTSEGQNEKTDDLGIIQPGSDSPNLGHVAFAIHGHTRDASMVIGRLVILSQGVTGGDL